MLEMPASPFLPGTNIQYAYDSTSLNYLKTCARLYYYTMICGYVPKEESIHLRFGQEYHEAIQDFENLKAEGYPFDWCVREATRTLLTRIRDWDPDPTLKPYPYKNKAQLLQLVIAYFDEYRDDPCKTVILENGKPAVELSFRFELDWGPRDTVIKEGIFKEEQGMQRQPYLLCGHLDRVVTYDDNLFVLDHKTTTTTPSDYWFNQWSPNNQMTLYTFGGKVVLDAPVAGVIVEAAQVLIDKPMKFVRQPTYRSDESIDEWLGDLEYHLAAAEDYATVGYWPMNDTACGMYGGCRFREVCGKSPAVRERYLKSDFIQLPPEERWNPLKNR